MQAVLSKVHGRCKGRKNTQPAVRPRAEAFNPVLGQGTSWRRSHCVATKRGVDERGLGERKGIGLELRSGRRRDQSGSWGIGYRAGCQAENSVDEVWGLVLL